MVLEMVWNIPGRWRSDTKPMAELHTRMEELERLKDQMQAIGMSIANAVSDGSLILNSDINPFPSGTIYS